MFLAEPKTAVGLNQTQTADGSLRDVRRLRRVPRGSCLAAAVAETFAQLLGLR